MGGWAFQWHRTPLRVRGCQPRGGGCCAWGTTSPIGMAPTGQGGQCVPPRRGSLQGEHLWGMASPIGAVSPTGGTGCPALAVVAARRAPAGDGIPDGRRSTAWGDGVACSGGGRCMETACEGRHLPLARDHRLGGWGVPLRRQSLIGERARGTASPIGVAPPADGTECSPQALVAASKAPTGDGIPRWRRLPPGGMRWGVPPWRWSLSGEHLRGAVSPGGPVPPTGRMGCPAQAVAAAWRAPAEDGIPHLSAPPRGGKEAPSRQWSMPAGRLRGKASPHWRGPTSYGEGVHRQGGGHYLESACGGRHPPLARPHLLGDK